MKVDLDLGNVIVTEFGVGRDDGTSQSFVNVPVDADVQAALQEMVVATSEAMERDDETPGRYNPSEKQASIEHLYLPLEDELANVVRELHEAALLPLDTMALERPANIFAYFVRLTDGRNRRVTGLRRATQFKGVLRSKNRLVRMIDDSLRVISDDVFKLDQDFDLLVDSDRVHILRPSGFEFVGKLSPAILAAVPENVKVIKDELHFVEFDSIEAYARTHPRAARALASIRSQRNTNRIDADLLKKQCVQNGVEISDSGGNLVVSAGHELGFLEILDRRRYEVELVKGERERFRAASRRKIER